MLVKVEMPNLVEVKVRNFRAEFLFTIWTLVLNTPTRTTYS